MKIEQAIVLYLLKNKYLILQGIGTFKVEGSFPDTPEDKPFVIPAEAVSFTYDPKATEDPQLIDFIVQATKKIKPLASGDLDSFLVLGRQFLNIGKPFIIHNLGTLEKSNAGIYEFRGGLVVPKAEPELSKIEDATIDHTEERMFTEKTPPPLNGRTLLYLFVLVLLVAAGWASWKYLFNKNNNTNTTTTESIIPVHDTITDTDKQKNDSAQSVQQKTDSIKNVQKSSADTFTFKVVVLETSDINLAKTKLAKWLDMGRKVILYTDDSVTYKIAHPFTLPLKDTALIMDSLNSYYYLGKAHVELKKHS